jgi:hypothetical protein
MIGDGQIGYFARLTGVREMIVVNIAGGLGNQMFEYAAALRLAHKNGVPLKLDLSGYGPQGDDLGPGLEAYRRRVRLLDLSISGVRATDAEIATVKDPYATRSTLSRIVRKLRKIWPGLGMPATDFHERRYRFDPDVLNLGSSIYLSGFWQSEKYFADIADLVQAEFKPRDPKIMEYAREFVSKLRQGDETIVSVHVRRGELAHAQDVLKSTRGVFGPPTGLDYIRHALSRFDSGRCRFLVFSDTASDIAWCKENIKADKLHFSEGHSDLQDMMLMSACDQHIIASTFSWWAAWLNRGPNRRVIAPSQWGFANLGMVTDDLIPAGWEMI